MLKELILTAAPGPELTSAIEACNDWYSEELDYPYFKTETDYLAMDNLVWNNVDGQYLKKQIAWHTLVPVLRNADEYDVVCFVIPEKYWPQENNANGYASHMSYKGTYFYCVRDSGRKRPNNKGWMDNNQLAGTIRHERSHILHIMQGLHGELDLTHKYDIDSNRLHELPTDLYEVIPKGFEATSRWNIKECMKAKKANILTKFTGESMTDVRFAKVLDNLGLLNKK
jgi:hypothetical protein